MCGRHVPAGVPKHVQMSTEGGLPKESDLVTVSVSGSGISSNEKQKKPAPKISSCLSPPPSTVPHLASPRARSSRSVFSHDCVVNEARLLMPAFFACTS